MPTGTRSSSPIQICGCDVVLGEIFRGFGISDLRIWKREVGSVLIKGFEKKELRSPMSTRKLWWMRWLHLPSSCLREWSDTKIHPRQSGLLGFTWVLLGFYLGYFTLLGWYREQERPGLRQLHIPAHPRLLRRRRPVLTHEIITWMRFENYNLLASSPLGITNLS